MIIIGDRMELMASMVSPGETVGDIGTDHGLLPLKLWATKVSPKVIMTDMSKPSLEKAEDNFRTAILKDSSLDRKNIDFRVGDGLQVYGISEVDVITIAGMGGRLIVKILSEDLEKTRSFSKLILQPRNGSQILRQYLVKHDFEIEEEALIVEGKYICEIMCVKPIGSCEKVAEGSAQYRIEKELENDDILWEIPIAKKIRNKDLFIELVNRKIKKKKEILVELDASKVEETKKSIHRINNEIDKLKGVLNEI